MRIYNRIVGGEEMKRPVQAILMQVKHHRDCEKGVRAIKIMEGHRDYIEGFLLLCCHKTCWCMEVHVTEVKHTTLQEIEPVDFAQDGYKSRADVLMNMSQYYPRIDWASPVTVVKWKRV